MPAPGSLVNFTANTLIKSADVDSNFSTLRTSLLTSGFIDTANTWAISQAFGAGLTASGTVTFSSGVTFASGTTIATSGVTFAGACTVASGTTITASGVTIGGGVSLANGPTADTLTITTTMSAGTIAGPISTASIVAPATQVNISVSGGVVFSINASSVFTRQDIAMNTGRNILGTLAPLATSATSGFIWIATTPGTITSTPGALTPTGIGASGLAALCYDTTNNRLQIYSTVASAWKTVALT